MKIKDNNEKKKTSNDYFKISRRMRERVKEEKGEKNVKENNKEKLGAEVWL